MIKLIIIFFKFLVGASALLLTAIGLIARKSKYRHYWPHLLVISLVSLAITLGMESWMERRNITHFVSVTENSKQVVQKAILSALEIELQDAPSKLAKKVKDYFNTAEHDFEARDYQDAAKNYQKCINLFPTMSAQLNLGLTYLVTAENTQSEDAFRSGLRMSREKVDRKFERIFLNNLGVIDVRRWDLNEAESNFEESLKISRQLKDFRMQIDGLNNLADIATRRYNLDEALRFFEEVFVIAKQTDYPFGKAMAKNGKAGVCLIQNELECASESSREALQLGELVKNPLIKINAWNGLGVVSIEKRNLDDGLKHFEKALDVSKASVLPSAEAMILNNIGQVHQRQGRLDEALEYLHQALRINKKYKDLSAQVLNYSNIGQTLANQDKFDEALGAYKNGLKIAEDIKWRDFEGGFNQALGSLFKEKGDFHFPEAWTGIGTGAHYYRSNEDGELVEVDPNEEHIKAVGFYNKSLEFYRRSLAIHRDIKDYHDEVNNLLMMGEVYRKLEKVDEALDCYEGILRIVEEIEYPFAKAAACEEAGIIYASRGEKDRALKLLEQAQVIYLETGNKFGAEIVGNKIKWLKHSMIKPES